MLQHIFFLRLDFIKIDAKIGMNSSEVFTEEVQPTKKQPRQGSVAPANSIKVYDKAKTKDDANSDGDTYESGTAVTRSPSHHSSNVDHSVTNDLNITQNKSDVGTNTGLDGTVGKGHFAKRRNRSDAGIDNDQQTKDDAASSTNALPLQEASQKLAALHEFQIAADERLESQSIRDVDFEVTLLSLRNRRVLLSRLTEAAPKGKLSMVRFAVSQALKEFAR